jgi:hypothetical protein
VSDKIGAAWGEGILLLRNLVYLNIASICENHIEKFLTPILMGFISKMPQLEIFQITIPQTSVYHGQKRVE